MKIFSIQLVQGRKSEYFERMGLIIIESLLALFDKKIAQMQHNILSLLSFFWQIYIKQCLIVKKVERL